MAEIQPKSIDSEGAVMAYSEGRDTGSEGGIVGHKIGRLAARRASNLGCLRQPCYPARALLLVSANTK
jgi:hypothetical protein